MKELGARVSQQDILNAMMLRPTDSCMQRTLLGIVLTTKIDDCEMYIRGIDYLYYYEEND